MKITQRSSFLLIAFIVSWLVGCASTPKVDWNTRVGNYTYDQAVIELGPPDKKEKLTDGTTVAEWIKRHSNSGFSFGVGAGGMVGGGAAVGGGVGHSIGSGYDRTLKLIFAPDNKLSSWSKNY